MRLFIAVNLSGEAGEQLCRTIGHLRKLAVRGSFTRRENLHLTLAFLGETAEVDTAKAILDAVGRFGPIPLVFCGIGSFCGRRSEKLYWAGVEKSSPLYDLQAELCKNLREAGFALESRPFCPHITLGREVILAPGVDAKRLERLMEPVAMQAERVSLMRSDRVGGKIAYTPVYERLL